MASIMFKEEREVYENMRNKIYEMTNINARDAFTINNTCSNPDNYKNKYILSAYCYIQNLINKIYDYNNIYFEHTNKVHDVYNTQPNDPLYALYECIDYFNLLKDKTLKNVRNILQRDNVIAFDEKDSTFPGHVSFYVTMVSEYLRSILDLDMDNIYKTPICDIYSACQLAKDTIVTENKIIKAYNDEIAYGSNENKINEIDVEKYYEDLIALPIEFSLKKIDKNHTDEVLIAVRAYLNA